MIHLAFDRPSQMIKRFDTAGAIAATYRGEGDAWGYSPENPYGHDGWCPPGHFILGAPQRFQPAVASEGFGQIPVSDITLDIAKTLVDAGKAQWSGLNLVIGGIAARIGRLSAYGRGGIMLHGGGSNAIEPFADYQQLCKTYGCPRMFNIEWRSLADFLEHFSAGQTVVLTIIGDPVRLPK